MAFDEEAARSTSPTSHDDSFPQYPRSEIPGPPSIISSRMTDIGTEDGGDLDSQRVAGGQGRDNQSRPGTARTGVSSRASRGPWNQQPSLRQGLAGKRASGTGSIGGSSLANHRPASSTSRSHAPSLTSHAFFRPMSSQKLQAQRGVTRPSTMSRQMISMDMYGTEAGGSARNSLVSNPVAQIDEADMRPPQSRGTEMTEPDPLDRMTANTSPTHGYNPTLSVADSLRPLHQKPGAGRNLTIEVDNGYGMGGNSQQQPLRTPRSFRSNFLIPSNGSNREIQGGEKLDSVASSPQLGPKDRQDQESTLKDKGKTKPAYVYQYFEGNTVFCLGGRLQNTRHRPINFATGSLLVIPCVLFFIFSAPWIWHNISPAIPITFAYLFYVCLSSLIHGSSSDPGILPRNVHQFPPVAENEDPLRLAPPTNDWTLVKSYEKTTAAMEVPTKYCKTCNIWRPPRAHHCRLCDNCIETQDHHCVWFNNCVGRRNYRYFFTFVTSATFLGLYLIGACLAQILVYSNQQSMSFSNAVNHFRVPFALVIYGFFAFLYPAALMGYHLFLMARGETTREYLNSHKFLKKDRYRAFTQSGWWRNWFVVLCRPRPPTYYGFKNTYAEGDQRLGAVPTAVRLRQFVAAATGGQQVETKEGMEMQDVKKAPSQRQGEFLGPVALRANEATNGSAAPQI